MIIPSTLKRYAEIIGVLTVFAGVISGIVSVSGGHWPPWVPFAIAQQMQARQTALETNQVLLTYQIAQDKLEAAKDELAKTPDSRTAKEEVHRWERTLKILDGQLTTVSGVPAN